LLKKNNEVVKVRVLRAEDSVFNIIKWKNFCGLFPAS